MTVVAFHASHEQVHPSALLAAVRLAQDAGFTAAMSSDHFSPWSTRQGQSGFAWSWLGAAMATTDVPFGVVNAPGQRYHPAIVAQASATLSAMFPQRLWVALGTGEASNEHITGTGWPAKDVRTARLRECVDVIRALHAGEEVTHHGLVTVDRARIWTLPAVPPALVGPAVSVRTAGDVAAWADGMATVNAPVEHLRQVVGAYRDAGGRGRLHLQVHVSWAPTPEEAERVAHEQWRSNVFPPPACWDIDHVDTFDAVSRHVTAEQVGRTVLVSSDLGALADRIAEMAATGFDEVAIHHVGQEQEAFVEAFGTHVLPRLDVEAAPPVSPAREVVP